MFAFEWPTCGVVIELGFTAGNIFPAHDVVAGAFVLKVTGFAGLTFHQARGMKTLATCNTTAQVAVIMTTQTLIVGQRFAAVDVTVVALVSVIKRAVATRQFAR